LENFKNDKDVEVLGGNDIIYLLLLKFTQICG